MMQPAPSEQQAYPHNSCDEYPTIGGGFIEEVIETRVSPTLERHFGEVLVIALGHVVSVTPQTDIEP